MNLNFWRKENIESNTEQDNNDVFEPQHWEVPSDNLVNGVNLEVENLEPVYEIEPADPEKAKLYNNISRWVVYLGVFLLPLFFLPWTTGVLEMNKQLLLIAIAGTALISWLLGIVSSGYLVWKNTHLDRGIIGLMGAFLFATIFSVDKFKSLFGSSSSLSDGLVSIIAFTVLYFLIANNIEDRGKFLKSILGLSISLSLIYGLLQMFGVHVFKFSFATSRIFNTVGSVNALGIVAAAGLPFFSKGKFDTRFLKNLYIRKVGVLLSLAFLFLVNWWVLWVIAIAGMVAVIIFESISGRRLKLTRLILPMTVIILAVFSMIISLDLSALRKNLPIEVGISYDLSFSMLGSVLKDNPVFGYGPENFSVAFDKYGAGKLASTTLSNARFFDATSEAMTLVVQGGLVMLGAIAFLLWSIGVLFWRFHGYVAENEDPELIRDSVGVLASVAAMVVALFLYPLNLTLFLFFYVLLGLVALIICEKDKRELNIEEKASLSIISSLGFIGGLILALVGVYFGVSVYMGDVKYAQALAEKDNERVAAAMVSAINWNGQNDQYYRSASQTALVLLEAEVKKPASAERDNRIQNYITSSVSLAKRSTEIAPREALNWVNLGFIYQNLISFVGGVDKLSEDAYGKAGELRPGDPAFAYRIGLLYLNKFDLIRQLVLAKGIDSASGLEAARQAIKKAEDNFKRAIELSPNFGLAIYNLGIAYDRQGEVGEAITQLEKIVPFNSGQPGLNFELGLLYYRAGRKKDALSQLQRAIVLAPDYANARWYLALIYEERGDLTSAVDNLEKILNVEINKDNPVVIKKLEELRSGQRKIPPQNVLDQQPLR